MLYPGIDAPPPAFASVFDFCASGHLPAGACPTFTPCSYFVFRLSVAFRVLPLCSVFSATCFTSFSSWFSDAWGPCLSLRVSCQSYALHDVRVTFAARSTSTRPQYICVLYLLPRPPVARPNSFVSSTRGAGPRSVLITVTHTSSSTVPSFVFVYPYSRCSAGRNNSLTGSLASVLYSCYTILEH